MPYIHVTTNTAADKAACDAIKAKLGQAITAIPGKSEQWLMTCVTPEAALYFQGSDAPAAMVEVSIYGSAAPASYEKLTGAISSILGEELRIPAGRIYVKYEETDSWGWNGGNF